MDAWRGERQDPGSPENRARGLITTAQAERDLLAESLLQTLYVHRRSRVRRFGGSALAAGISLLLHGAIFLGFCYAVFSERPGPRRLIIPEARLLPGQAIERGPSLAPAASALDLAPQQPPDGLAQPAAGLQHALEPLPDAAAIGIVAAPAEAGATDATSIISAALAGASGSGSAAGGGGQGATGRRGGGPPSSFFGQAGNAYDVVYVVDVSASLMIYIGEIIHEMRDSINDLLPTQRFHIVLAKPGELQEFGPRRLVPAISRYKTEATAFLDSVSGIPKPGKADPIGAMRRAFAVGPELIYFLTDGDYPDIQGELEAVLRQLNAGQTTRITTIGFDPSPGPRALLERIARQHGGNFRVVEPKG